MEAAATDRTDADTHRVRRLVSECWIYTRERGLRAVTLHGNGSSIALDGQRLRRWNVLDRAAGAVAIALVYSAEMPSRELQERVAQAARERFRNEPWFTAEAATTGRLTAPPFAEEAVAARLTAPPR
jgi:hypothetical protein